MAQLYLINTVYANEDTHGANRAVTVAPLLLQREPRIPQSEFENLLNGLFLKTNRDIKKVASILKAEHGFTDVDDVTYALLKVRGYTKEEVSQRV